MCVRRDFKVAPPEERVVSAMVDRPQTMEVARFARGDASRYFSVFDSRASARARGPFASFKGRDLVAGRSPFDHRMDHLLCLR